jgi:RNA recognition motif-containing protein
LREIVMKNIFIGNLDFSTTEDQLRALFATHGAVETVTLVRDRDTGRPRGFAFLEMTNGSEAEKAIQALNGTALGGGKLTINEARPKLVSDRSGELRKREHRLNRF